ncbi:hypothetical protein [Natronorubrum thiooxidans]|uniref:Uncharacterized protein n=1 Tax=Natronorubrum thiooxidans TaxID=308853 RepID=A0A1N7D9G2_9EURY|nr:hypothetical protein [Natronorubrum thiooxidans]SIR72516.1 hypothetical protein SAMN05421752_10290 [Natronorubrum thiooxidans]
MNRTGGYVQRASDTVERGCKHCDWYAVAGSYPKLVKKYHDHLRDDHPMAWVRS